MYGWQIGVLINARVYWGAPTTYLFSILSNGVLPTNIRKKKSIPQGFGLLW